MPTPEQIHKQQQLLARYERHLALEKIQQRKQDTRRKIELGGLVIKAKMDQYPKAVILGALMDAVEHIQQDDSQKELFKIKGEAGFMGFEK